MIHPLKWTHEDRAELLFSAVAGAVFGVANGYVARSRALDLLLWALIFAIIAPGMVYCLRTFRS
jgi:hypothetical protein